MTLYTLPKEIKPYDVNNLNISYGNAISAMGFSNVLPFINRHSFREISIMYDELKEREQDIEIKTDSKDYFVHMVIETVCEVFHTTPENIHLKNRKRFETMFPRQVAHKVLYQYGRMSLGEVGHKVGKKDHATVLNSMRKVDDALSLKYKDSLALGYEKTIEILKNKGLIK